MGISEMAVILMSLGVALANVAGFWRDLRHESGDCSNISEKFENVEDEMARWSSSVGVECGALSFDGLSRAANVL